MQLIIFMGFSNCSSLNKKLLILDGAVEKKNNITEKEEN